MRFIDEFRVLRCGDPLIMRSDEVYLYENDLLIAVMVGGNYIEPQIILSIFYKEFDDLNDFLNFVRTIKDPPHEFVEYEGVWFRRKKLLADMLKIFNIDNGD